MNLDHDIVQVSKLSEDQKKGLYQKWNTFSPNSGEDQKWNTFFPQIQEKTKIKKVFTKNGTLVSPNSSGHLRSDAHQSQIIRGMQM